MSASRQNEGAASHHVLSADHQPVDAMRRRQDETGDGILGAPELEHVRSPDRQVGALARSSDPMSSRPSSVAPPRVPRRSPSRAVIADGPPDRARRAAPA